MLLIVPLSHLNIGIIVEYIYAASQGAETALHTKYVTTSTGSTPEYGIIVTESK